MMYISDQARACRYAMDGSYNLRRVPADVLVKGGADAIVRRRISEEELLDTILTECR
jgi:hypothetical protein